MTGRRVLPVLVLALAATAAAANDAERTLVPFRIRDQFDRVHTEAELESRPVIVLCGDRKGSRYQGAWADAIRDSLRAGDRPSTVLVLEVADLRGVPFFVKGSVKRKFPRAKESWVLLDWSGHFAKTYAFRADLLNLALFDEDGVLVYQTAVQKVEPEELERLLRLAG